MSLNAIQHIEYKAKAIQLDTLGKLCEVLDCQPGDLLVWMPGGDRGQESRNEQEEKELEQNKDYADETSFYSNKRTRSLLTVISEVPESA